MAPRACPFSERVRVNGRLLLPSSCLQQHEAAWRVVEVSARRQHYGKGERLDGEIEQDEGARMDSQGPSRNELGSNEIIRVSEWKYAR